MKQLNIKKTAQKAVVLAEIFEGKDKMDTDEIIKTYPNGIHINNIEFITMQGDKGEEQFWAYTFDENPNVFAFSGFVLAKIFNNLLEDCEGDYEELYESFKACGGLSVKLYSDRTKKGQPITKVDIL